MRKKDLLKQSKKLAAVITAAAMLESSIVPAAAADSLASDTVQSQNEPTQETADSEEAAEPEQSEQPDENLANNEEVSSGEISEEITDEVTDNETAEDKITDEVTDNETAEDKTTDEVTDNETAEDKITDKVTNNETTEDETTDKVTTDEEVVNEEVTDKKETDEDKITDETTDKSDTKAQLSEDETNSSDEKNGWVQDDNGNWNYYEDGTKYVDRELYVEDEETGKVQIYRFDKEGNRLTSSWYEDGDSKYYYDENGCQVKGTCNIDGNLYFFFDNGVRADADCTFSEYDEETQKYVNYRTDENGCIYTGWYTTQDGSKYYYGADGKGVQGITEIDGETYYFDEDSSIWQNYLITENGYYYYFGDDGKLEAKQDGSKDGWFETSRGTYYIKDGVFVENQIVTVNGEMYYVDYDGCLHTDGIFSIYDKETGKNYHYCSDSDGRLIIGWYKPEDSNTLYYYGEDGRAPEGITTIDGKTYYFSYGWMHTDYTMTQDGVMYYFGTDGNLEISKDLSTDGWFKTSKDQYYIKDGAVVKRQFITVDGFIYYVDSDGSVRKDTTFSMYDGKTGKWYTYYAGKDGRLVTGWYTDEYDNRYYYDQDGRRADGVTTIDGNTYYFQNGTMRTDYTIIEDGCFYYFGKEGKQEVKKDLSTDGWIKCKEDWFYAKDGKLVQNQLVTVGKYTYYMDYSGKMVSSQYVWIYEQESGNRYIYYIDKDGHAVTGWMQQAGGRRYYFEQDGRGANGVKTIEGKTYYFSDGVMQTSCSTVEGGYIYYFGADGVQQTKKNLKEDGWVQMEDKWFYVKSGELVKNDFLISGKYIYYFDSNGRMCTNTKVSKWDDETEQLYYYYLDKDGHVIKGWYTDEYKNTYYFDKDGRSAVGITVIDEKTYYFDEEGRMRQNYGMMENGYFYFFGTDGTQQVKKKLDENGWFQVADKWYYAKDGDIARNQFIKDNKYIYYVGSEGSMLLNRHFEEYDSDTGKRYSYYVDKNGHMVTGWYQDEDNWYYYDSNGRGAEGITTVKNVTYYFLAGKMQTDYSFEENGYLYYFDIDGIMQVKRNFDKDGWVQVGTDWYYVKSKELAKNQLVQSGRYTYYLDYSGKMVVNEEQWISGYIYRFDEKGHMVIGWYQQKDEYDNTWHYYDAQGHAVNGIQNINGKTYYFTGGRMKTRYVLMKDDYLYYFDANGVQSMKKNLDKDGWLQIEDNWYYIVNKKIVQDQFIKIGNYTYSFDYDGVMRANSMFSLYDSATRKSVKYYADDKGHLITGWFKWYGYTYYFANDGHAVDGIVEIDGKTYYFKGNDLQKDCALIENGNFYYFNKNGNLLTKAEIKKDGWVSSANDWFYVKNGQILKNQFIKSGKYTYYLDNNGMMCKNQSQAVERDVYRFDDKGHMVTGWYQDGLTWYYHNSDGTAVNGTRTINGKVYCFDNAGQMQVNKIISFDGTLYYVNGNGIATPQSDNGWICNKYYVENGKMITGWKKLDNKWYYLSAENGEKYAGGICSVDNSNYYFDSDGVMKTGWIKTGGQYIYAESSGKLKQNAWMNTDSKWYYFDNNSYMAKGIIKIGGAYHTFNSDGTWNKRLDVKSDGWIKADTIWYYFQNQKPVISRTVKINGKQYRFDENGIMLTNTENDEYYYSNSGAALQNQWREIAPGKTEYYGADGKRIKEGWQSISGNLYYLRDGYRLTADDAVDGKLYHFDADGQSDGKGTTLKSGWNLISGHYYYYKNGKLLKSKQLINGKNYFFDNNGQMESDICISFGSSNERYRIEKDGSILAGGWSPEHTYYADDNGVLATGMQMIDGKTYIFADWGYICVNSTILSEDYRTIYKTNAQGEISSTLSKPNQTGWVKDDGSWYYVKNGVFMCNQILYLNGKTYYLNADGKMLVNGHKEGIGYAENDGVIKTNGWGNNNAFYYENGRYVTGARTIDGKNYFFDEGGNNISGLCYVDGVYYLYDGKGNRSEKKTTIGWNKLNNDWYYIKSEGVMAEGIQKINGKYYCFSNGRMLVDNYVYDREGSMYFDENGVLFTGGWKQIYGNTYYFDKNGRSYSGKRYIDGKWYTFTREGVLVD